MCSSLCLITCYGNTFLSLYLNIFCVSMLLSLSHTHISSLTPRFRPHFQSHSALSISLWSSYLSNFLHLPPFPSSLFLSLSLSLSLLSPFSLFPFCYLTYSICLSIVNSPLCASLSSSLSSRSPTHILCQSIYPRIHPCASLSVIPLWVPIIFFKVCFFFGWIKVDRNWRIKLQIFRSRRRWLWLGWSRPLWSWALTSPGATTGWVRSFSLSLTWSISN